MAFARPSALLYHREPGRVGWDADPSAVVPGQVLFDLVADALPFFHSDVELCMETFKPLCAQPLVQIFL
jgi:hypothetical protein